MLRIVIQVQIPYSDVCQQCRKQNNVDTRATVLVAAPQNTLIFNCKTDLNPLKTDMKGGNITEATDYLCHSASCRLTWYLLVDIDGTT